MPKDRLIAHERHGGTLNLLLACLTSPLGHRHHGFKEFLMPAMALPESRVVNLRFVEARRRKVSMAHASPFPANPVAFCALTSIDMSVNYLETLPQRSEVGGDQPHALAECLRAATGLRHLKLRRIGLGISKRELTRHCILRDLFHVRAQDPRPKSSSSYSSTPAFAAYQKKKKG